MIANGLRLIDQQEYRLPDGLVLLPLRPQPVERIPQRPVFPTKFSYRFYDIEADFAERDDVSPHRLLAHARGYDQFFDCGFLCRKLLQELPLPW